MSMSVGLLVGVCFFSSFISARAQDRRQDDVTVTGKWELVGKEGEWKNKIEIVAMDGFLWSVEKDGSLFKTESCHRKIHQGWRKGSV
jgi:hypothetical protein